MSELILSRSQTLRGLMIG